MFDAVNDFIILIDKNDIAVFAHDFHYKCFFTEIPHLVQMLNMDPDNTLQAGLGNIRDPAILQMLSKKHTKTGSCHGTLLICFREVDKGKGCTC